MRFSLKLTSSSNHPLPEVTSEGNPDLLTIERDGDFLRILVGRVYRKWGSLSDLAKDFAVDPLSVRGRFLFVQFDATKKQAQLWTDKYRLLQTHYVLNDNTLWLGNELGWLSQDCELHVDPIAVASLKQFGAVLCPRTLYQELRLLEGSALWDCERRILELSGNMAESWPSESGICDVDGVIQDLRSSLDTLYEYWKPQNFRLSGGVDTRTIALLSSVEGLRSMRAQVLCHPHLSPETDRDVLGARMLADRMGLRLDLERPEFDAYNYLPAPNQNQGYTLSGLHGGEFLGGLLYQMAPWTQPMPQATASSDRHSRIAREEWSKRLGQLGLRRLSTELYLSAFRSIIYQSVRHSWASPFMLSTLVLSPFVESRFLDRLLMAPFLETDRYQLYARVYRKIAGQFADIPLMSPIVDSLDGFTPFQVGVNPKLSQDRNAELRALSPLELAELNLKDFFSWAPRAKNENHRSFLGKIYRALSANP